MKKVSKRACWIVAICGFLSLNVLGQQAEHETVRRQRTSSGGRENWMAKRLMSKDFVDKVGLQGEQAQKLKASLEVLEKQLGCLDKQIEQAAAQQAKVAKKVLSEPGAGVDEIMKLIDQIGAYRIQQAKLATQRLVVIRDNLTPEQREKAFQVLREEQKKNREEKIGRVGASAKATSPKNNK